MWWKRLEWSWKRGSYCSLCLDPCLGREYNSRAEKRFKYDSTCLFRQCMHIITIHLINNLPAKVTSVNIQSGSWRCCFHGGSDIREGNTTQNLSRNWYFFPLYYVKAESSVTWWNYSSFHVLYTSHPPVHIPSSARLKIYLTLCSQ